MDNPWKILGASRTVLRYVAEMQNRRIWVVGTAYRAHHRPIPRPSRKNGAEIAAVDTPNSHCGIRDGRYHLARKFSAEDGVRNLLCRRLEHWPDANVVGIVANGVKRLRETVGS